MRWLFIGAGNMASSLIGGLLNDGVDRRHVAVMDPQQSACSRAEETFGITGGTRLDDVISSLFSASDENRQLGVVIAVKPGIVEPACRDFAHFLAGEENNQPSTLKPLFVSVAAGVRQNSIQSWLPEHSAIVRCMPNTPALLGLGITALHANTLCTEKDRELAERLLNSCGKTIWVEKESDLDAVTAVSGSGPAYFFYLMEHMINAGTELGLDAKTAEILAVETAFGAASMARQSQHPVNVLRENVTSKGGTTAAALKVFDDSNLAAIVTAALKASQQRAVDIGDELAP